MKKIICYQLLSSGKTLPTFQSSHHQGDWSIQSKYQRSFCWCFAQSFQTASSVMNAGNMRGMRVKNESLGVRLPCIQALGEQGAWV